MSNSLAVIFNNIHNFSIKRRHSLRKPETVLRLQFTMATPGGTSSGGIPRLLYSESVHAPLLREGHLQYGVMGTGASSGGMSSESGPRHFSEALNPGYVDDDSEAGNGTVEIQPPPISPRAVDESGTIISPRTVLSRSTEVPGKFGGVAPYNACVFSILRVP